MGTITKKIIKLIEGREGLLPDEIKEHLIELKEEIKNLEKQESDLINRTYMVGYMDKESNRRMKGNYYKETYEPFKFVLSK
jgi:hypothetical protein